MPNIFDYLDWRGDLPLSADPFNDVDNLILAELTYTHFEGLVPEDQQTVPITEVHRKYFETHSRKEIRESDNVLAKTCFLMDGMVAGERFSDVTMSDYINIVDSDRSMQMSAVTYHLGDGTAYVAFRGTDNTVVGWKEDFIMSYLAETRGQGEAIQYLNRVGGRLDCPIRVGGHSKGGNFAVYASAFCDPAVQDKIAAVYSNDGPGFRQEVMAAEEYDRIVPKIRSIVPDSSVIGMLLASEAEHKIVKSSARLMAQHDGMTWQVLGKDFIPEERTDFSRMFDEAVSDWLGKISDDSRESFVNSLFSALEATGAYTFGEMKGSKLKSLERIISAAQDMPKDKQQEFLNIALELLASSGQTVKRTIEESFRDREKDHKPETQTVTETETEKSDEISDEGGSTEVWE